MLGKEIDNKGWKSGQSVCLRQDLVNKQVRGSNWVTSGGQCEGG